MVTTPHHAWLYISQDAPMTDLTLVRRSGRQQVPSIKYTFDPFEALDIPSPSDYGSKPLQAPDDPEEDENLVPRTSG